MAGLPLLGSAKAALAQGRAWPEHEISMMVGFGAGGASDLMCRAIAGHTGTRLKVPVVVRNQPGAGGTIAAARTAQAKPDGYTIGHIGTGALIGGPLTAPVPYKPREAFSFIACVAELRFGICVGRHLTGVTTLQDLVALSKTRRVTYCQTNPISAIAMFALTRLTGGEFEYIQFASIADGLAQVAGGHLDAVIGSSEILGMVSSGDLRLLASAGVDRWPDFPAVPTLQELGYDAVTRTPSGFCLPAGTPEPIRARFEQAMLAAVQDKEVLAQFAQLGIKPLALDGAGFETLMHELEPGIESALRTAGMLK
jgi:tripartite-type tricarboxylate transporter receptor subunit TctC